MTNKFIESSSKKDLLEVFWKCLYPFQISKTIINSNLDHALHGFQQEMRIPFESFIKSSPQDMKHVFYQILLKHFIISLNSDKEILGNENFEKITTEVENLLK